MGKSKAVLLHLLAVAAGWGIVAALRPVVGSWLSGGGDAAAESRAPSKTGRIRSTAEIAAGQKILQRFTDSRLKYPPHSPPGPELSFEELLDKARRGAGFDPAAKAPSRDGWNRSKEETNAAEEYYHHLDGLLSAHLNGEHGPDLAHAFRHGRLDAGTLHDSLAVHLPGPAADGTLRRALYRELAPHDPARAAALLQPLPADVATDTKYESLGYSPSALSPDTAFAVLSSIPPPSNIYEMQPHQASWESVTEIFHRKYGSDYHVWLEQLPAGTARDEAAVALLSHLQEHDLPGYRRIRALVADPRKVTFFPPR